MTVMNKAFALIVVAAAGCAARSVAEESPAAVSGAKVRLEEARGNSVFVFEAKTSLADGTRFDLRLYYVRRYKIPPGLVEPGQPDFEEELIDVDKDDARSSDGSFGAELGSSDLPPWPGQYRVVASWPDENATGEDGQSHAQADLDVGAVKDLPAMRAKADREVYEDMARIGRVLDALRLRWGKLGDAADAAWADFRKDADRRINAVKERNGRRRKAELYWMECRGKQRVDWILQKVCPLLDKAAHFFPKPAANRPDAKELDLAIADTEEDYQHYLDFLGFGRIIDAVKVDAALGSVLKIADEVKAWRGKAATDLEGWLDASADISGNLMEAALNLSGELPEAYFARAEAVQKVALRMLDHVREVAAGRAPVAEWADLETKMEAAVKELRDSVPRVKDE
ncbi:MAG: hypothetical protein FD180_2295 [Planctomycetota bacterium]|nr:MAG: hypothetical protein FD180_2295 [Planctomycetota bacterium]